MATLNTTSCAAFNGSLVIGDVVKTVSGSPDGVPVLSTCVQAGIVGAPAKTPITALVELQSSLGGLVVPRMTTAQQAAMPAGTVPDGTIVYLTDGANFSLRINNAWVVPGVAAGEIIGPGVSVVNAVATWNNLVGTSLQNTTLLYAAGALSGLTSVVNGAGTALLPSYSFAATPTTGMWSAGATTVNFSTTNGQQLSILDGGALTVNQIQLSGSPTGAAVKMAAIGTDANIDVTVASKGTGNLNLNLGATPALLIKNPGGALVNYLEIGPSVTGSPVVVTAEGGDANVGLSFNTAGTGAFSFFSGNGLQLQVLDGGALTVNNLQLVGSPTGTALGITAAGADANISILASPKGTGLFVARSPVSAEGGLRVLEAANSKQGVATLVAGTVVVANTSITANSRIIYSVQAPGGTQGFLSVTKIAATSFTLLSSNNLDTSTVAYEIFEPA